MKKLFILFVFLLILTAIFAKQVNVSNLPTSITVLSSNNHETLIDYKIGKFNSYPVIINGEEFNKITVKNGHYLYKKGLPEIPVITKSIIIPNNAKMQTEIIEANYKDFNIKVAPSKGKILRTQNPDDVPYEFSEIYQTDNFYPENLSDLGKPYILRDFRGITVTVNPFVYNPVTHTLRVYYHIKLRVKNIGIDTENVLTSTKNSYSIYFKNIYKTHFINFDTAKYDLVDERGRLIVIAYPDFINAVQPYVEWKKQKGMDVQVYNVADIGSAPDIQDFIQNQYDQNDDLTFVQLIGDAPQVPTLSSNGGGADPKYALVAGNDPYMDIFVGRFSAETVEQVETQVQRTIWYEKDIQDGDWIQKGVGIASSQGTGDDNEYDYQHQDVIRQKLLDYGYTQVDQLYDTNGVTAQDVANALNQGRGIVNYTGHGSDFSWVSSNFDINDVNALTNDFKLPFIQSVACVVGNFTNQTCFAEAWLRATNNETGNPTGAIAFFGSTINQSWSPPMSAQDEYIDMITGSVNYEGTPDVMKTIGGLWFNGEGEMLDLYNDTAMSETWHIFGDASLMIRTKTPQAITVNHTGTLFIGANSYNVQTDTPDAQVCLYANGIIYATGYTDNSGSIILNLPNPPQAPMDLTLTVTAYNKITYIAPVSVIPSDGPYVLLSSYTLTTDNGDNIIEFGETVNVSITLENVGSEDAENVNLQFQNVDDLITFTDNSEPFGNIPAGQSVTINNCVSFNVSEEIQNNQSITLPGTITATDNNWNTQLLITAYTPVLSIQHITVNDSEGGNGNGRLDPGETADIILTLSNTGGAKLSNITGAIDINNDFITINQGSATLNEIAANSTGDLTFNISVSEQAEVGSVANFSLAVTGDHNFSYNDTFSFNIGLILEDFETGDFSSFPWEFNDGQAWTIVDNAYEGNYAAKSGDISDNQTSSIELSANVIADGTLSFYYKVSSESGYDFFKFYIDGEEQDEWSGDINWTQASYEITSGQHTFKWSYIKDASVSNGDDSAWLDYIIFPSLGEIIPPNFVITPDAFDIVLPENGTDERILTLSNQGGGQIQYSIGIFNPTREAKSIDGSTLECDLTSFMPGNSYTLTFTVTNNSNDAEWLTDISIAFPAGIEVTGSTDFTGGSAPLTANNETGDGVTVTWYDADGSYGNIHNGETATATVDINISSSFSSDMILNWHMVGDQWGSDPHELDGQISIPIEGEPITWISLSQTNGVLNENQTDEITVSFNSNDLELGNTYNCELRITDNLNRNVTVIPVTLHYGQDSSNDNVIPLKTALTGNYPNPFNPTTKIVYSLKNDANVKLEIYNLKGQLVKTLKNSHEKAGYYSVNWNGKNNKGKKVGSGMYLYRLQAGKQTFTKRMIMLK